MEQTIETFEAMCDSAESQLDLAQRKLENDFSAECSENAQVNGAELLHRIAAVKNQFKAVSEDVKEIQKAQEEAMLFFRDSLSNACTALTKLQSDANLDTDKPEELKQLEEMLGMSSASAEETSSQAERVGNASGAAGDNEKIPSDSSSRGATSRDLSKAQQSKHGSSSKTKPRK